MRRTLGSQCENTLVKSDRGYYYLYKLPFAKTYRPHRIYPCDHGFFLAVEYQFISYSVRKLPAEMPKHQQ